jgi:uncharacterized integral membrane protein
MRPAAKAKAITAIVLGVIAAIVAFQNLEPVNTRLLFVTVTMPRILILLIMLGIGFVLGVVVSFMWTSRLRGFRRADQTTGDGAPPRRV